MVALSSVGAAIGLTSLKIVVALLTGSLGIMAEAAHSGLDLVAALMTFFAVRVADRPADADHNYGHAKIENLSAFFEAGLLLLTGGWVIYEAIQRLYLHEKAIEVNIWAFLVMGISIVVDVTRSKVLLRVAKKLGSQALEADALHFQTDIWSSAVVIMGLLVVFLAKMFHLPDWFGQADAVAALGVSGIVIWVSLRLAKETIDTLLDRAPDKLALQMQTGLLRLPGVNRVRRIRVRRAGNKIFVDMIIAAPRTLTFEQIHRLSEQVELTAHEEARQFAPQAEIDTVVHVEPIASPTESITDQIHYLSERQGVHAHDIHVREVNGRLEVDFDLEVHTDTSLQEAHEIATKLEQDVLSGNADLRRVTTHLEAPNETIVQRQDVTEEYPVMTKEISRIANGIAGFDSAHDIHLYCPDQLVANTTGAFTHSKNVQELDLVLHTIFDAQAPLSQVHVEAEEIKRALRRAYPYLNSVTIHTEPPE